MLFMAGEVGFDPFRKFAPRKHDSPPTALAFKTDICPKARHSPFVGTTGMLFAEAQMIVKAQIREHGMGTLNSGN